MGREVGGREGPAGSETRSNCGGRERGRAGLAAWWWGVGGAAGRGWGHGYDGENGSSWQLSIENNRDLNLIGSCYLTNQLCDDITHNKTDWSDCWTGKLQN